MTDKRVNLPEGRFAAILREVTIDEQGALMEHLLGGTSANWLSKTLTDEGHPISATTIKDARARLRNDS